VRRQPDDWLRFHTMSQLGAALAGLNRYADAEPMLVGGYEGLKAREASIPASSRRQVATAAARIVPLLRGVGPAGPGGRVARQAGPARGGGEGEPLSDRPAECRGRHKAPSQGSGPGCPLVVASPGVPRDRG
jgi:hypothetical protein